MTATQESGPDQALAASLVPWPGWRPRARAVVAVEDLAELMVSRRALRRQQSSVRVGVVCDAPTGPHAADPDGLRSPEILDGPNSLDGPGGERWMLLATEMAWIWANAAADSTPGNATVRAATVTTSQPGGRRIPLHQAVEVACRRAGLLDAPTTADRLLVLISPAQVSPGELAATRDWLDGLRAAGCATLWLCPTTVACHTDATFPCATVHLIDPHRPYPVEMLGAAAREALDRAASLRRHRAHTRDTSARRVTEEFHVFAGQVASALGTGWSTVPDQAEGALTARTAILRGPGEIELAMTRGRVVGHWHIEGRLADDGYPDDPADDPAEDPADDPAQPCEDSQVPQSPPGPLVPVGSTPDQVAAAIRDGYLTAWAAYTAVYAATRATGSGS